MTLSYLIQCVHDCQRHISQLLNAQIVEAYVQQPLELGLELQPLILLGVPAARRRRLAALQQALPHGGDPGKQRCLGRGQHRAVGVGPGDAQVVDEAAQRLAQAGEAGARLDLADRRLGVLVG